MGGGRQDIKKIKPLWWVGLNETCPPSNSVMRNAGYNVYGSKI